MSQTFGGRIKQLRRDKGLTQRQVAAELDIDFTYLSKLENDRGEPPGEDTIRGLSTIFGVDPEELLALAGKIPAALKERAQQDPEFAVFLRRLANLSPEKLKSFYKAAGVKAPKP